MGNTPQASAAHAPARRRDPGWAPAILLGLLILAYAAFFSSYCLQRHATLNTFAADLSYIDQPMWNTLHGRFLERTLDDRQAPRIAEHLEPILLPLSLVYLVWDDVRAILILQTLALAVGALPVFWIARWALRRPGAVGRRVADAAEPVSATPDALASWLALAFAAVYLLFPALQAANIADFHADPFVVAPLLFAFWYATQRRYRPMWAWALVAMATKENLPTLTAMLGLYVCAAAPGWRTALRGRRSLRDRLRRGWDRGARHGLALIAVSLAWFYVATFLIVAPQARAVYGTDGPIYLASRYVEFEGGLSGALRAMLALLRQPVRVDYLAGLLASVGWLALLAPEYLLLGLPVLAANTLSSFPGQFSGEQHYSAPLVPALMIAAVFGARRLRGLLAREVAFQISPKFSNAALMSVLIAVWLLGWSVGQQIDRGWTPLARPFDWPERIAHHAALGRLLAQVPGDAAVSATPAVHPHLAHRTKVYLFPIVADADFVLVDISGDTGMHPNDVKATLENLITSGAFGIADAADGFALLSRTATQAQWPAAFFDFARAGGRAPQAALDVRFGDALRLVGYDVVDDPRWRLTRFRFYWQTDAALSADTAVSLQVLTPDGAVADDSALRPMPALLWRPPAQWQPGETMITESVPWFLPRAWAPTLAVTAGGTRLAPVIAPAVDAGRASAVALDGRLRLPGWERHNGALVAFDVPSDMPAEGEARFAAEGWSVALLGWAAPFSAAPGADLRVSLHWQSAAAAPMDYTVFLHLRDDAGRTWARGDGQPTWFIPLPASRWLPGASWDAHAVKLPADLPPGRYSLVVGWYAVGSGQRLALLDEAGNPAGDEYVLGPVTIDPRSAPRPDVCCLFTAECCASLE